MATIVSVETEPLEDQTQPCGPEHEVCTNYSRRAVFQYTDWQERNLPAEFCWVTYTTYGMAHVVNKMGHKTSEGEAMGEELDLPVWWQVRNKALDKVIKDGGPFKMSEAIPEGEYLELSDYNVTEFMWATDDEDFESILDDHHDYVYEDGDFEFFIRDVDHLEQILKGDCATLNFERDIDPTADRN